MQDKRSVPKKGTRLVIRQKANGALRWFPGYVERIDVPNGTFSTVLDTKKRLSSRSAKPTDTKGDVIFCSFEFDCWLCDVCAERLARKDENQAGGSRALALCAKCQPELQRRRGVTHQPLKRAHVVWRCANGHEQNSEGMRGVCRTYGCELGVTPVHGATEMPPLRKPEKDERGSSSEDSEEEEEEEEAEGQQHEREEGQPRRQQVEEGAQQDEEQQDEEEEDEEQQDEEEDDEEQQDEEQQDEEEEDEEQQEKEQEQHATWLLRHTARVAAGRGSKPRRRQRRWRRRPRVSAFLAAMGMVASAATPPDDSEKVLLRAELAALKQQMAEDQTASCMGSMADSKPRHLRATFRTGEEEDDGGLDFRFRPFGVYQSGAQLPTAVYSKGGRAKGQKGTKRPPPDDDKPPEASGPESRPGLRPRKPSKPPEPQPEPRPATEPPKPPASVTAIQEGMRAAASAVSDVYSQWDSIDREHRATALEHVRDGIAEVIAELQTRDGAEDDSAMYGASNHRMLCTKAALAAAGNSGALRSDDLLEIVEAILGFGCTPLSKNNTNRTADKRSSTPAHAPRAPTLPPRAPTPAPCTAACAHACPCCVLVPASAKCLTSARLTSVRPLRARARQNRLDEAPSRAREGQEERQPAKKKEKEEEEKEKSKATLGVPVLRSVDEPLSSTDARLRRHTQRLPHAAYAQREGERR